MYIHVNTEGVVIDATEEKLLVGKNPTTGKKVILKRKTDEAIGVIGSNDVIRQLAKAAIEVGFYTVYDLIPVSVLPEDYEPGKYVYSNGKFSLYEGTAPKDIKTLTEENAALTERADGTDIILDDLLTNVIPSITP